MPNNKEGKKVLYKINENGVYINLYPLDEVPLIEIDDEWVEDPSYISTPFPNDIYISEERPPKWTGTEWVATAEPPEPTPQPPSDIEKLEAKITAANEYTDFLEEVIVEMAQAVYE